MHSVKREILTRIEGIGNMYPKVTKQGKFQRYQKMMGRMATEIGIHAKAFKTSCNIGYRTRATGYRNISARLIANNTRSLKGLGNSPTLCCHPSRYLYSN